ncbi:MAG TPA: carboxylating nicotinate-nucleotide diphosphorylase [Bacteroidales bacterium]|nr:carboxylating nicotinate-nucleotide diphosphorylase [Bacteroidales bacterium]
MKHDFISDELIINALREDIGQGDVTTRSTVPQDTVVQGKFIAKQQGVICGLPLVERVFQILDPEVLIHFLVKDGDKVSPGMVVAEISGNAASILSGERVALNLLQFLSGIATYTAQVVESVKETKLKILDTRKTLPCMRALSKYAVRVGGGSNHRLDLAGGVLIKDNHIKAAGSITHAVIAARIHAPFTLKIEVETETLQQVQEALNVGADIIMLDNMDIETMREAVRIINGRAFTEASGNMDRKNLLEVAATGVDAVSIGSLTNNTLSLDVSLKLL